MHLNIELHDHVLNNLESDDYVPLKLKYYVIRRRNMKFRTIKTPVATLKRLIMKETWY